MHASYSDITSRIAEPPTWYDENGTPRYGEFSPGASPNIYADQVVLLRIRCQECGEQFRVELHSSNWDRACRRLVLDERVRAQSIEYGDPPIHDCGSGDTMNSIPERVLEFWQRDGLEWMRLTELEVEIDCEWARGER